MSGINFENIKTIASAIGSVASCGSNIEKLIATLTGSQSTQLNQLLEQLEQDIVHGLGNVVNAINDDRLSKDWGEISSTLTYVHTMLKAYQEQLSTVKAVTGTNNTVQYQITTKSSLISLQDWCYGYQMQGSNISVEGALPVIAGFISLETITSLTPNVSSLSGIFQYTGPGSSSSGLGANAISRWQEIFTALKQSNSNNLPGNSFINYSVYDSMLRLMSYIHNLVSLSLYVHDSAMALLIAANGPQPNLISLQNSITNHFGNYSTPGTVWHKFNSALTSLGTATAAEQLGSCAYSPEQLPGNVALQHVGQDGDIGNLNSIDFCTNQVSLAGSYPNSFFSAIGFCQPTNNAGPTLNSIGYRVYVALQGTITTVGPGPTFNINQQPYPDLNDYYNNDNNWVGSDFGYPLFFSRNNTVETFEPSYVNTVPTPTDHNHITVITGFQLVEIANGFGGFNMAIALQFGELNLTDVNNPVVNIKNPDFIPPIYTHASEYQQYTNSNQVGCYSNAGVLQPNILTNATFCRISSGDVAANVQSASTIYQADFLQPANLPAVFTTGTKATA